MMADTSFTLTRLLSWLDADPRRAGARYVQFQKELTTYLERRGAHTVAETLAEEALDRVDKRLATSLLNEHHNSNEILDAQRLCRSLCDEGVQNSPGTSRRIWNLLPDADRALVTTVARAETFERRQRSLLSRALNEILRRRDFYRPEDFDLTVIRKTGSPLHEKIEAEIAHGPSLLSQNDIERFNRRLLDAWYPKIIKTNLPDTPDEEKLSRCKHFARVVLIEYLNNPVRKFESTSSEHDERGEVKPAIQATANNPVVEAEEAEEQRRRLDCQQECKRLKLSPRDRVVLDKYFTGIEIRSSDDEPLEPNRIRDVRKAMADELGVAPETIRTIAHRSREVIQKCIERCMKRQGKK